MDPLLLPRGLFAFLDVDIWHLVLFWLLLFAIPASDWLIDHIALGFDHGRI